MDDNLSPELAIAMAPSRKAAENIRNQFVRNGVKFDENKVDALQKSARTDTSKPGRLSLGEQSQLQQLKTKMVEASLDQQRIAKQGGQRAVEQKARAGALFSENIHRGAK